MIRKLIINFILLLEILLHGFQIAYLAIKSFIFRLKDGYFKRPHLRTFDGCYGSFGSGKTCFVADYTLKMVKKYGRLNCRILSNIEFDENVLKKYGVIPGENYRVFKSVDDLPWLLETKIDEKTGKKVPAYDWGLFLIDEACAVLSNRDVMNSKKGKGVVNKDFLVLCHQLRKFNTRGFALFQDDGIDLSLRRIIDIVYCPHMYLLDRLNIIKTYKGRAIFSYLDDPNTAPPEYLNKFMFVPTDATFNFYDTNQLVEAIAEGDYFRPNDKDLPSVLVPAGNTVISSADTKQTLGKKLFGNKTI